MRIGNRITVTIATIILGMTSGVLGANDIADEIADRQEKHLAMLKEKLELTDGQVNEIRAIMESARLQGERDRQKFREARDPEAGRKASIARQQATEEKIRGVFNDKQKKEYDKIIKEMPRPGEKGGERSDRPGGKGHRGGSPRR